MKATTNKVTERIKIAFKSRNEPVAITLNVGDIIKWELGDYSITKGERSYYIPKELMELIHTEPLPTLDVSFHPNVGSHEAMIYVNDWAHFTSEQIAQKVKECINNLTNQ